MEGPKAFYRAMPPVNFSLADAKEDDVIYKYYKGPTQTTPKQLTIDNVAEEKLDKTTPLKMFTHGWKADDTAPWFDALRDEYFKHGTYNIIYINWYKAASTSYDVSCANIKPLGRMVAEFLVKSGVLLENIHLIGHSLGCHLLSFIGKEVCALTGQKLGRITGLDPAGPKFENGPGKSRLGKTDANFVDVVHTDIQYMGYTSPIGHVDFYPNEGKHQPACPIRNEDEICSHIMSTSYFMESIGSKCIAKEAVFKNFDHNVTMNVIPGGKEVIFGEHVDKSTRGVFYLKTNSDKPYLNCE